MHYLFIYVFILRNAIIHKLQALYSSLDFEEYVVRTQLGLEQFPHPDDCNIV